MQRHVVEDWQRGEDNLWYVTTILSFFCRHQNGSCCFLLRAAVYCRFRCTAIPSSYVIVEAVSSFLPCLLDCIVVEGVVSLHLVKRFIRSLGVEGETQYLEQCPQHISRRKGKLGGRRNRYVPLHRVHHSFVVVVIGRVQGKIQYRYYW